MTTIELKQKTIILLDPSQCAQLKGGNSGNSGNGGTNGDPSGA